MLDPVDVDPIAGAALRANFFVDWQLHWGYIRSMAPFANIFTLIDFLKDADRTRFWQQRNFCAGHLPYVLLSTYDFPPPKGKAAAARPEWLRFRFDGRYRTLADLWIWAEPEFAFLRLRYRAPKRKRDPGPRDFICAESITPNINWPHGTYAQLHPFALTATQKAFPIELG